MKPFFGRVMAQQKMVLYRRIRWRNRRRSNTFGGYCILTSLRASLAAVCLRSTTSNHFNVEIIYTQNFSTNWLIYSFTYKISLCGRSISTFRKLFTLTVSKKMVLLIIKFTKFKINYFNSDSILGIYSDYQRDFILQYIDKSNQIDGKYSREYLSLYK